MESAVCDSFFDLFSRVVWESDSTSHLVPANEQLESPSVYFRFTLQNLLKVYRAIIMVHA